MPLASSPASRSAGHPGRAGPGQQCSRGLPLCLLGRFLEPLQSHPVLAQVDSLILPEFIGQVIDHALIEVLAAQESISVGRLDLEHALAQSQARNIGGAAAKVEYGDLDRKSVV